MSGKIQKKFFVSVLVAVLIPLLLCTIFFAETVKKNSYKDARENDHFNIQQISKRLEGDLGSVETIGNSCCYGEDIRRFLRNMDELGAYEYVTTLVRLGEDMAFYQNISSYIQSIGITKNGSFSYWKYISSYDDKYNMEMFGETWYEDYLQSGQISYYSQVHSVPTDSTLRNTEPVISRIKKVVDINTQEYLGEIIINIKVSEIEKTLKEMDSEFDSVILDMQGEQLVIGQGAEDGEELPYDQEHMRLIKSDNDCTYYSLGGNRMIKMTLPDEYGIEVYGVSSNREVNMEILRSILFLILGDFLCLLLTMKVMSSVIRYITKPILELTTAVEEISKGNLDVRVQVESNDEIERLADGMNIMVVKQKQYIQRLLEYEKEKKEYEFEILISQINPHFLYNTLNTISFLALRYKHEDIHEISISLIRLLQDSIQVDGNRIMSQVKKEVEVIHQYATIQKYRYKDRFTISYLIDKEAEEVQIPKSILQPLVENALFHGICPKGEPGEILLIIKRCALDSLAILVKDDGIGMAKEPRQHTEEKPYSKHSIGLSNIRGRLKHLYSENWIMDIKSQSGVGTTVLIIVPMLRENETGGYIQLSEDQISEIQE